MLNKKSLTSILNSFVMLAADDAVQTQAARTQRQNTFNLKMTNFSFNQKYPRNFIHRLHLHTALWLLRKRPKCHKTVNIGMRPTTECICCTRCIA